MGDTVQELRVYEFAKRMGIDTISLMDKLREWDISVKSHMATLDPDTMETIKEKMEEEEAQTKKKAKKKKTKAKAKTTAKAKTKSKAKKKAPTKKKATTKKKVVRTRKAKDESVESTTEGATKKIVRRKKSTAKQAAPQEEAQPQAQPEANLQEQAEATAPATQEAKATSAAKETPKRKNIVGKIDLAKVEAYAKTRVPQRRPATSRPASSTGGPSPASKAAAFIPDEPTAERSRKEKGRKKLARNTGAEEGPKSTTTEEENASFNRTDFRKREAIFQPKKKKSPGIGENKKTKITKPKALKRQIQVEGPMTVADVAKELKIKPGQLIGHLMKEGMQIKATEQLDYDTIALIAPEYDYEAIDAQKTVEDYVEEAAYGDFDAQAVIKPPVVTVMGHVDHGKTSLLDAIRKADVAGGEAGGITQHIGAYQIKLEDEQVVTFLDTPGHEAFTEMRARGATATDVAVIVIAADDGVMPQTAEAINHAKAAGVPIIVAVNKIDTQGADMDKIKQQLTEFELVPEEWGGSTMFIGTSATEKTGIKELVEAIHLQAEMLELQANPKRSAKGVVIESKQEKGRGIVATILVQEGTLKKGDEVAVGSTYGRIKMINNDKGEQIKEASPGMPVEILGLNDTPLAGDPLDACKSDKQAKEIAEMRREKRRQAENITPASKMSLEELFSKVEGGETKELPVVLKTDVAGSVEAIKQLFDKVSTSQVNVKTIHYGVGGITESDVHLASSAGAILVGFNVRPDGGAREAAKREGVQIKSYNVIYELGDDIRKAMKGLLDPKIIQEEQGVAEVRELFRVPGAGTIAGCYVTSGKIHRGDFIRVVRDGTEVYNGKVDDLRRFKDSVKEVAEGYECGISVENFNDIKVGDNLEAYNKKEIEAELES